MLVRKCGIFQWTLSYSKSPHYYIMFLVDDKMRKVRKLWRANFKWNFKWKFTWIFKWNFKWIFTWKCEISLEFSLEISHEVGHPGLPHYCMEALGGQLHVKFQVKIQVKFHLKIQVNIHLKIQVNFHLKFHLKTALQSFRTLDSRHTWRCSHLSSLHRPGNATMRW